MFVTFVILAPRAAGHGEGGPEVASGTLTIAPDSAGGSGYAEAQFRLFAQDRMLYQWSVQSPEGEPVSFNLHGHSGAVVLVFGREEGGKGGGSLTAPHEIVAALMWQSNATAPVNVSYSVQLQHAPDLYSSSLLTANLAGLVALFAAVWEISIRGRRKVEQSASGRKPAGDSAPTDAEASGAEARGASPGKPERAAESPPSSSYWTARRRAAIYALVLLLTTAPVAAYLLQGVGPAGSVPKSAPYAAFVGHEQSANLTVVDPVFYTGLGQVRLPGIARALAADPQGRAVYAAVDNPPRLLAIEAETFARVRDTNLSAPVGPQGIEVSPDGSYLAVQTQSGPDFVRTADGSVRASPAGTGLPVGFLPDSSAYAFASGSPVPEIVWVDPGSGDRLGGFPLTTEPDGPILPSPGFERFALVHARPPKGIDPSVEVLTFPAGLTAWNISLGTGIAILGMWWSAVPDRLIVLQSDQNDTIVRSFDAASGLELGRVEVAGDSVPGLLSRPAGMLYLYQRSTGNVTSVDIASMRIEASIRTGPPSNLAPVMRIDRGGHYLLVVSPAGELVTLHDQPGHHEHSRLPVGPIPTHCILVEASHEY